MKTKLGWFCLALILILLAAAALYHPWSVTAASPQSVHFLNVGQGDSILLMDGHGYEVLIDGGDVDADKKVVQDLLNLGVTNLETMVTTHADVDHFGGLIAVLESDQIQVDQVLYNGYDTDGVNWEKFKQAVANKGLTLTTVQFPSELSWGQMKAYVLNPRSGETTTDKNSLSLVFRVDFGCMRYLFTGDVETPRDNQIVARQTPVVSQVLKVPHHGGATASSAAFLAAVDPDEAVISVGPNSYGHPSDDTLARLTAAGAEIWRTDQLGDVDVSTDGLSYYQIEDQWNPLVCWLNHPQYLPIVVR